MRTAITLAKTHTGKWELLATPDDSLIQQKQEFRALRADRAHPKYAIVIYQESDGHAEINRLLTKEAKARIEAQRAEDQAAAAAFDQAELERRDPARKKAALEAVHKAAEKRAAQVEEYAKTNSISVFEAENILFPAGKKNEAPGEQAELDALSQGDSGANSPASEFTSEKLKELNHGDLLAITADLFAAGRLPEKVTGKKSDLIAAILSAKPKPATPPPTE